MLTFATALPKAFAGDASAITYLLSLIRDKKLSADELKLLQGQIDLLLSGAPSVTAAAGAAAQLPVGHSAAAGGADKKEAAAVDATAPAMAAITPEQKKGIAHLFRGAIHQFAPVKTVKVDISQASRDYDEAVKAENVFAMTLRADLHTKDAKTFEHTDEHGALAIGLLKRAGNLHHSPAIVKYALLAYKNLDKKTDNTEKYKKITGYLKQAIELNDDEAKYEFARMEWDGHNEEKRSKPTNAVRLLASVPIANEAVSRKCADLMKEFRKKRGDMVMTYHTGQSQKEPNLVLIRQALTQNPLDMWELFMADEELDDATKFAQMLDLQDLYPHRDDVANLASKFFDEYRRVFTRQALRYYRVPPQPLSASTKAAPSANGIAVAASGDGTGKADFKDESGVGVGVAIHTPPGIATNAAAMFNKVNNMELLDLARKLLQAKDFTQYAWLFNWLENLGNAKSPSELVKMQFLLTNLLVQPDLNAAMANAYIEICCTCAHLYSHTFTLDMQDRLDAMEGKIWYAMDKTVLTAIAKAYLSMENIPNGAGAPDRLMNAIVWNLKLNPIQLRTATDKSRAAAKAAAAKAKAANSIAAVSSGVSASDYKAGTDDTPVNASLNFELDQANPLTALCYRLFKQRQGKDSSAFEGNIERRDFMEFYNAFYLEHSQYATEQIVDQARKLQNQRAQPTTSPDCTIM